MKNGLAKIAVLTSGGDAPGMNATIRAVVRSCAFYKIESTGVYRGYQGLVEGDFERLTARSVKNIINRGGTFLKSTRSTAFMTEEGQTRAHENLLKNKVNALVVIGGNGTLRGAREFQEKFSFPVVGIPATIDNDIFGTDFTIGYDTALNTVVEAVDKIRDTANSHNRLFLVEVMGHHTPALALNAGIGAGAEEIMIPEENLGTPRLLTSLERSRKSGKLSSIIVVAEGDKPGKNAFDLAEYIQTHLKNYDVRVTVLGHIQRGGAPSCYDRVLGSRLGVKAIETIIEGNNNTMVGVQNQKIEITPLKKASSYKRKLDKDLLRVADITSI